MATNAKDDAAQSIPSAFELTAADLSDGLAVEGLGDETALGTWGSASSWSSASCPASSASSAGSASSFG